MTRPDAGTTPTKTRRPEGWPGRSARSLCAQRPVTYAARHRLPPLEVGLLARISAIFPSSLPGPRVLDLDRDVPSNIRILAARRHLQRHRHAPVRSAANVIQALTVWLHRAADHYTHFSYEMSRHTALRHRPRLRSAPEDIARPTSKVSAARASASRPRPDRQMIAAGAPKSTHAAAAMKPSASRSPNRSPLRPAYFMLKFTRNSVIASTSRMLWSFEGETGPYTQYAWCVHATSFASGNYSEAVLAEFAERLDSCVSLRRRERRYWHCGCAPAGAPWSSNNACDVRACIPG